MSTAERTDPKLWEKVKDEITKSGKGGDKDAWSARKAQLAVQEYKKRGGGYQGEKSDDNDLKAWTDEDWGTESGNKSGDTGERYLPKRARMELSDDEYARTTAKKRADTGKGKQFSGQPDDVARKTAKHRGTTGSDGPTDGEPTKADLLEAAREQDVPGRSKMSKAQLSDAVEPGADRDATKHGTGDEARPLALLSEKDLDDIARRACVEGRSMTKADLTQAIAKAFDDGAADAMTKAGLSDVAQALGVEGRSRMTKVELAEAVRAAAR